ncbi:MAG TPA: M55 family metallopeptidase [Terriglobia bacterium]|nr:M55 family metallopeptidase [Terriglobia bacterium]
MSEAQVDSLLATLNPGGARGGKPKKVFMITDLEGVSGVFSTELQCEPLESPRFQEARKLLTGEVNAAVDGLLEGGATGVVVWDGHDSSRSLSALDINPKALLLTGQPVAPTLELDSSYAAMVFVGQHAMAGAMNGILNHSFDSLGVENMWINNKPVGEIGVRVMLAGSFGVPVIMLSGDAAACQELHALVPQAECAAVKSGAGRTAGFMLPHPAAAALIRDKARRAMERLNEIHPYKIEGPVEAKVQFTTRGVRYFQAREGVEQIDERTWAFRGKDLKDAWLKYSSSF